MESVQMLCRNGGVNIPLSVYSNILYPTDEIKVLGVTLDDSLNFKFHVTDICSRAFRQINLFKRFAKYLKIDRWLSVYKRFIQSNFSHCPLAWIFMWKENSNKLEKLQERALRIFWWLFNELWNFVWKGKHSASFNLSSTFLLSIFKRSITAWCHSDAAKALESKMFWSIHFRMLSLHGLINVADRHFRSFCSFIIYHFLIVFIYFYTCSFAWSVLCWF